jgi:hypothetical protein
LALEAKVFLKHDEKGRGTRWFTSNSEPQNDSREARDNNVTGRRREGLYTKRQVSDDRTRQEGSRGSMLHCREQRDRNESSRRVVATGSTAAMVISTPTTLASQKPWSLNHDCLGRGWIHRGDGWMDWMGGTYIRSRILALHAVRHGPLHGWTARQDKTRSAMIQSKQWISNQRGSISLSRGRTGSRLRHDLPCLA